RGSESDLTRSELAKMTKAEDVEKAYPGWDMQVIKNLKGLRERPARPGEQDVQVPGVVGPKIAHDILLVVLVLIFLEVVLAWQFGHYSAASGTQQPAKTG